MKSIRKVLWERLMERRRALKTLEIAREIVKSEDGAGGEISKEQKEEILFSGFTHRQKMDYMRAVKEIEEEKKLESNNPKLENFLSL